MRYKFAFLAFIVLITACGKDEKIPADIAPHTSTDLYFPPINSTEWKDTTTEQLNWNMENIEPLFDYLSENKTRAFIVLKDGKIVLEKYWGKNILNTSNFDQNAQWYWASAGKSLSSTLIGIAQAEGALNIDEKTSKYLGVGWTSMPKEKEDKIRITHQLTMTTGLDYTVDNTNCTSPECLKYKSDAGQQWFYHNAPYTLLDRVVINATGKDYNEYTQEKIGNKIGLKGKWVALDDLNVYWSSARDAARFGLLLLNKGFWDTEAILKDSVYFNAMTHSSQDLNPSYGYLTWLNGKSSIVLPSLPTSFNTSFAPVAPLDLFAAMGKNGQFIDVVPSKNMVVVRLGEAPDNFLVPTTFHNSMWEKIMTIIN